MQILHFCQALVQILHFYNILRHFSGIFGFMAVCHPASSLLWRFCSPYLYKLDDKRKIPPLKTPFLQRYRPQTTISRKIPLKNRHNRQDTGQVAELLTNHQTIIPSTWVYHFSMYHIQLLSPYCHNHAPPRDSPMYLLIFIR